MLKITKVNQEIIEPLKVKYLKTLAEPMDDMWEHGIIPSGDFYTIEIGDKVEGYFVVDGENTLNFFYVMCDNGSEVFEEIISKMKIKKANIPTYDLFFYKEAKRLATRVEENTILYSLDKLNENFSIEADLDKNIAKIDELDSILTYFHKDLDMSGEWLKYYFSNLISNLSLYLYKVNGKIIGTGELRPNASHLQYAHIGVTVSKNHRSKGVATYIINDLTKMALEKNYQPICSTTVENIPSQKTLSRGGYKCSGRIDTAFFDVK